MIDEFCIFNKGGAVLWSRQLNPPKGNPIDSLIQHVLMEERSGDNSYSHPPYLLKWVFANEIDLVFVAVYLDLSHLSYVDNLLEIVKKEFIAAFKDDIAECQPPFKFDARFEAILDKFEQKDLEDKAAKVTRKVPRSFAESRKSSGVAGVLKTMGRAIKSSAAAASASSSGSFDDDADADGGNDDGDSAGADGDDAEGVLQPVSQSDSGARATKQQDEPTTARAIAAEPSESTEDQAEPATPSAAASAAVGTDASTIQDQADAATTSSSGSGGFKVNADKLRQLAAMRGGRLSRPGSMIKRSPSVVSPPPAAAASSAPAGKEKTQWANRKLSAAEMKSLDYSSSSSSSAADGDDIGARSAAYGAAKVDKKVFEYDDEDEKEVDISVETEAKEKKSTLFGWFEHLSGNKVLDKDDLDPVLENIRQALMTKNVAAEIAAKLCGSVTESLIGKKIGSFSTVRSVAKQAMEEALLRILTPRRPVDMLHGVQTAKENGRPYSVVFCGVNGVGKSTSLAKITNFLQAHSFKVSLVACDTFRAGAVEQLRTHSKCLGVDLFEQGYDKDAAFVAQAGIRAARAKGTDVVLIDTAGRMQNNENLMKALAKLIHLNTPDLVLFVGEALVGNDGVDQLDKFNKALERECVDSSRPRGIDGIVLTKFDTIDDKVGAAISMTYISGQPIMFVGTGQTYTDLKRMNSKTLIKALLK